MRICAVSLPELRIELVRGDAISSEGPRPLAVVVAPLPLTEAKLLGTTRLTVVSREARALGVLPGQTIAQARARAGSLSVRIVRPEAVRDVLARIAEVGLAFGATVSFGMAGEEASDKRKGAADFGDIVWIDVTGCAHLHAERREGEAPSIFDGETLLASRLMSVIAGLGHTCSVAIADGPRVAAMLAQTAAEAAFRTRGRRQADRTALLEPIVVRSGDNARAIAPLLVTALPLPSDDVRWLTKIGVSTIEELRALPREGLAHRLGASARDVLALVDGDDRAPLTPYNPPEIPEEDVELEYGIEGTEALTFVTKTLADRLASRLQGRAVAAARVELDLHLDAAINPGTPPLERVVLDLPSPLSSASDLLAALRPKIDRLVLVAPVLKAKLRAPVLVHKRAAVLSLFEAQPKAERALPRLVAELVSDLGPEAVSVLTLGDSWVAEDRSRLVGFGAAPKDKPRRRHLLSTVPEPTRLLPEPRPIAREDVRVTRHLARLETVEWWKERPGAGRMRRPVDYVQAWTDEGVAWVEIERATGTMRIRGWFD